MHQNARGPGGRESRRGNVVIILALLLVVLLGFAALSVDVGYARVVHAQLENTSEAAARAASQKLDGTAAGVTAARTAATSVALQNEVDGHGYVLDPNDSNDSTGAVVLGVWSESTETFVPSTDPTAINAVDVRADVPNLNLFFAPSGLLRNPIPISAETRVMAASGGASSVSCYIPLALPKCQIDNHGVSGLQSLVLKVNPPGVDNVGWARPNGTPNANWTRNAIDDCQADGLATVGDPVGLQNGVVSSAMSALASRVSASSTSWSTSRWGTLPARSADSSIGAADYGKTYEGAVMVFDGGASYCSNSGGSFNQSKPLAGFVWGAIYDVVNSGPANSRTIYMRIDTSESHNVGVGTGGPDYGVVTHTAPRMVH